MPRSRPYVFTNLPVEMGINFLAAESGRSKWFLYKNITVWGAWPLISVISWDMPRWRPHVFTNLPVEMGMEFLAAESGRSKWFLYKNITVWGAWRTDSRDFLRYAALVPVRFQKPPCWNGNLFLSCRKRSERVIPFSKYNSLRRSTHWLTWFREIWRAGTRTFS